MIDHCFFWFMCERLKTCLCVFEERDSVFEAGENFTPEKCVQQVLLTEIRYRF